MFWVVERRRPPCAMRLVFVHVPDLATAVETRCAPDGNSGRLPPDLSAYQQRWEEILTALDQVTPQIEDDGPGRAYLNVGGLERHYRDETAVGAAIIAAVRAAAGLDARIGVGEGKFVAYAAARCVAPGQVRIVPRGDEAAFVAPLPVDLLPLPKEARDRLRKLGLDRIGDLARFSLSSLEAQFRAHGRRLWELV